MDQRMSRCGFYGKLASHGDFMSRRLSPAFLRTWDTWLQESLTRSHERLGQRWQATYLCSPIWRFALASGVCGAPAWAGVVMPSADRVGRCFPLTLAFGGPPVSALQRIDQDGDWYATLERLALSTLDPEFCLSTFDNALFSLREPSRNTQTTVQHNGASATTECWFELPEGQHWETCLPALKPSEHSGRALFWTNGSSQFPPSLLVSNDLPGSQAFTAMLKGRQPTS
jgi:type VI secretion system protein ImpM